MTSTIKFIRNKSEELFQFLKLSQLVKREIAGAYVAGELDYQLIIGKYARVKAAKVKGRYISFHTHIAANNPPSGNDISDLIYRQLTTNMICSLVISPEGIWSCSLRRAFKRKLRRVTVEKAREIKNNLIAFIDNLVISFHQQRISSTVYISKLKSLGIRIHFIRNKQDPAR
jgi:hypothetical protein